MQDKHKICQARQLGIFCSLAFSVCKPCEHRFCFTCFVQRQSFFRSVVSTLSAKTAASIFSFGQAPCFVFSRPPPLNLARLLGRLGCLVCHSFDAKTYAKLIVQFVVPARELRGRVSFSGRSHSFRKLSCFLLLPSALSRFRLDAPPCHLMAKDRQSGHASLPLKRR